ncbi:hypothetical protein J6590_009159 [Homalodisca vitripennis]|nr:hypothetical protein J6590_009159 [Homalodisca vitripennis]
MRSSWSECRRCTLILQTKHRDLCQPLYLTNRPGLGGELGVSIRLRLPKGFLKISVKAVGRHSECSIDKTEPRWVTVAHTLTPQCSPFLNPSFLTTEYCVTRSCLIALPCYTSQLHF